MNSSTSRGSEKCVNRSIDESISTLIASVGKPTQISKRKDGAFQHAGRQVSVMEGQNKKPLTAHKAVLCFTGWVDLKKLHLFSRKEVRGFVPSACTSTHLGNTGQIRVTDVEQPLSQAWTPIAPSGSGIHTAPSHHCPEERL